MAQINSERTNVRSGPDAPRNVRVQWRAAAPTVAPSGVRAASAGDAAEVPDNAHLRLERPVAAMGGEVAGARPRAPGVGTATGARAAISALATAIVATATLAARPVG